MLQLLIVIGLIVFAMVLVVRAVAGDGYGVRPGPPSHPEDIDRWVLPHDENCRSGR